MKTDWAKKIWRLASAGMRWQTLWLTHRKYIVGVCGVVVNKKGEILLLQHRFWPEGSWGLPSGYMQKGETYAQTVAREIKEETGYSVKIRRLINIQTGYKLRIEVFCFGRITGGKQSLDKNEVIKANFFNRSKLPKGIMPEHKEVIVNFLKD